MAPDEEGQKRVMNAIYGEQGIKAGLTQGGSRKDVLKEAKALVKRGAQAILLGCTELPLVLAQEDLPVPLIDPLQILAEVVVKKARSSV